MTKRQLIESRIKEIGGVIDRISWQPIGKSLEMCGASGGWEIYTQNHKYLNLEYPIVGYNAEMILMQLDQPKKD